MPRGTRQDEAIWHGIPAFVKITHTDNTQLNAGVQQVTRTLQLWEVQRATSINKDCYFSADICTVSV